MNRTLLVLGLLVGLPVVLLVGWLISRAEWRPRDVDVGLRGEARRNPLLALERLFGELGVPTQASESLVAVPDGRGVLFWRASGRFAPPGLLADLGAWVREGNHVVLVAPSSGATFEQIRDDIEAGRFKPPLLAAFDAEFGLSAEVVEYVELDLGHGPREVRIAGEIVVRDLVRRSDFAFPDAEEARVVSWRDEAGRVSVVAGDKWLENLALGERDHASLAWELATLDAAPQNVWIARSERPPGLLKTLFELAWPALVGVAVFTALALWRAAGRFGPVLPDEALARRDFSEHIEAAAEFQLRVGARRELLLAPRRRLAQRLAQRHAEFAALSPQERAARLAERSALGAERVAALLDHDQLGAPSEFTNAVKDLERIRKGL